ncbi:hypothetical protein BEI_1016 [Halomonas beimenensis]|uniref:Uncharacterized protein n=1 Tax=Halomonas beimenensis TaxID=475662 RepID=A0A291P532_9GAMM|nr:hypothetical protein BEI_1016 [Halomonas beimenensis]
MMVKLIFIRPPVYKKEATSFALMNANKADTIVVCLMSRFM